MDQLLARLSDVTYELFGIFFPGSVGFLFLFAWWWAFGDLASVVTHDAVPALTIESLGRWIHSVDATTGFGVGVPLFVASYFLGQLLMWSSRFSGAESSKSKGRRLFHILTFRIKRADKSYDPKLDDLCVATQAKLSKRFGCEITWRQMYPVAKSLLAESGRASLLATYQNKYTFHRSVAFAAVALLWFCVLATVGLIGWSHCHVIDLKVHRFLWIGVIAVLLALSFASSFRYYWEMWGNSVVTETAALLLNDPASEKS